VKIVLDECIPVRFRLQFPDYECVTVQYLQAKGLKDGPLLEKIAPDTDVFITVDTNLRSQQNFKKYPRLAVILLTGKDTDFDTLLALVPEIQKTLRGIRPGQQVRIP
jgi:predicted nuclease of predicted toxin-antitoxin system